MKKVLFSFVIILLFASCISDKAIIKGELPVLSARTGGSVRLLSHYLPSLVNSPGDTYVYVLDSKVKGPGMLIAAGVHGAEYAGIRAAEFFIEHAIVRKGKVFVIPNLNKLGYIAGFRNIPRDYQGLPDPKIYIPPEGSTRFDGYEQRNINRAYPGSENMGLAQQIALAVMNLLNSEKIKIAFDLHESPPSAFLAWMIISNPKDIHIVDGAVEDLKAQGIIMKKEVSGNSSGLSHREWGDRTQTFAFLTETGNPYQDQNPSLYLDNPEYTLERRMFIQLEVIRHIVANSNKYLSSPLIFSGIPVYRE